MRSFGEIFLSECVCLVWERVEIDLAALFGGASRPGRSGPGHCHEHCPLPDKDGLTLCNIVLYAQPVL